MAKGEGARRSGAVPHEQRRQLVVDGVYWTVHTRAAAYDRRARPDLIFESDGAIRRVRDYPTDWLELSDEALYQLSWRR